jgi:hypothetical protein
VALRTSGMYKKEKQRLSSIIDELDKIAETWSLSDQKLSLSVN